MSMLKLSADKWIQGLHTRRGAFTSYCNSKGFKGVTPECIAVGKKSSDPLTRKRATLAGTFHNMKTGKGLKDSNSPRRAGWGS